MRIVGTSARFQRPTCDLVVQAGVDPEASRPAFCIVFGFRTAALASDSCVVKLELKGGVNEMAKRPPVPQAHEVMTARVDGIDPDAEIVNAIHMLLKNGHSGAPVLDAQKHLLGVLSEHDCIRVLSEAIADRWPQGRAADHMTKEVETVAPNEDVLALASRFGNGSHRRLFVVDGERLVGVITRSDLLRALAKLDDEMSGGKKSSTYELIQERHRDLD